MTIEEMKEKKQEMGYSYEKIAQLAKLPVGTVQKVLGGITKSPRYETLKALESVFRPKQSVLMRESQMEYFWKKNGDYTVDDYFSLPEDRRAELLDGVLYDLAAPTTLHQLISSEIFRIFREYIVKKGGACIPVIAPIDVQLCCNNKNMVQPDVAVVCSKEKFKYGRIYGAPDLVVEVTSPATAKYDNYIKSAKYLEAGVRECWIVDPIRKRILVHDFENAEPVIEMYTFQDEVPVRIFHGDCKVDFRKIYEYVIFLYEEV